MGVAPAVPFHRGVNCGGRGLRARGVQHEELPWTPADVPEG